MANETVIIDVVAKFKDKITDETKKAKKSVADFEKSFNNLGKKKASVRIDADTTKAKRSVTDLLKSVTNLGKKKSSVRIDADTKGATSGIKKVLSSAGSFAKKSFKSTLSFLDKATTVVDSVSSKARSFAGKVWKSTLSVVDKFTSPLTKLKNMLFSINTLIATVATGLATKLVVADPINMADTYTTSHIFFETKLGSTGAADKMMSDIMSFAKDTPFDTQGVVDGVKQMMAYGIEAENVMTYMEKIGNATSALGAGEAGIDSVTRALGQMRSAGRVNAQDMMQLTSVGINAWDYLAKGMGKSVAEVRKMSEDGEIDATTAIKHIMDGLSEFDGMMDKVSNRTVKGILSNLKDAFDQSIVLKWGQGLQKGAVAGLQNVKTWLDKIDPLLQKAGTSLEEIGEAASSKVFEVLGGVMDRAEVTMNSKEFQEADLGGKIKILWDDVIWQPFVTWWDSTGKPKLAKKMGEFGESLGTGISNGLLSLLGIDVEGALNDGASIGSNFAEGFAQGFDGEAVGDALWKAFKKGFSGGSKGLADLLLLGDQGATGGQKLMGVGLGLMGMKLLPSVLKGGRGLINFGKGTADVFSVLKGSKTLGEVGKTSGFFAKLLGNPGSAMVKGSGLSGLFSSAGYALSGGAATSTLSGGAAAALGGGSIFGGLLGANGVVSGAIDIFKGVKSDDKKEKKTKLISGTSKIGMVGTGALAGGKIGALIGSAGGPIGTGAGALIGAGIGGVGALFGGDKFGKWLSDATDEGGSLNWNTWKSKAKSWYYGDAYDSKSGKVDKGWYGETGGFIDKVNSTKKFFTDTIPKKWNEFWDGAGEFFTETIPQGWEKLKSGVSKFFTETIPEKWDEFWEGVGEKFNEIKEAASVLKDKAVEFFTETIPEKWDEFWEGVGEFFTETVPYAIGYAAGKVYSFFTETLPEKWDEFWTGVGDFFEDVGDWTEALWEKTVQFFTETIPEKWNEFWDGVAAFFAPVVEWGSILWDKTVVFFTETIPEKWNEFWDGVGEFFTETIPAGWEIVKSKVGEFFTVTIPGKWNEFWDGVTNFFTETIPESWELVKSKLSEFFTVTIPAKWNEFWDGISNFFTQTIPEALSAVGSGISTFFTSTLPGFFSGLWDGISSWISEKASSFWSNMKSGWSDGGGSGTKKKNSKKTTKKAAGGFVKGRTLSWLAEEGTPEVVIPLGSHRRSRAMSLWERTGELLGVQPQYNALGGIVGGNISETPSGNAPLASYRIGRPGNVTISIGNITFQVTAGGDNPTDILAAIKSQKAAIVEVISEALYEALLSQFGNTPMAAG